MTMQSETTKATITVRAGQRWSKREPSGRIVQARIEKVDGLEVVRLRHAQVFYPGRGTRALIPVRVLERGLRGFSLVDEGELVTPYKPEVPAAPASEKRVKPTKVNMPRASPRELEAMRERARDYDARGYGTGLIADALGVSESVVRRLLGAA